MKVLGILFSNIHDKETFEVTKNRTIASTPIGGRYRLIDFTLSSMVNSGISDIGVVVKNNYQSLLDHVGSGKEWDLARKNGGLTILPPYTGFFSQTFNNRLQALKSILPFIEDKKADYVVLCDCFNVCNIDYKEIIEQHRKTNAEVTCVYRRHNVSFDDYMPIVTFEVDKDKRITKYETKRNYFGDALVSTETWVMNRDFLVNQVKEAIKHDLRSFNRDILQKQVSKVRIYGYEFKGFFRSIGSMESFYDCNIDLIKPEVRDELFNQPHKSIYTKVRDSAPTKYHTGCVVDNSVIADGCDIKGTVINSVLFRGVTVEKGAVVRNSVLLQDTYVSSDCNLDYVVSDKNVSIISEKDLVGSYGNIIYLDKGEKI